MWPSMARSYVSRLNPCTASRSWDARPDATGLAGEGRQELELGRRQGHGTVGHGHPAADQVEHEVARHDALVGEGHGLGPAQDRPDARDELAGAEGLDHVVVGAELQAGHPVRLVAARGEDEDRHARVAADGADDVEAVDPRQAQVQDEGVRPACTDERQRGRAVARRDDGEPGVLEVVADDAGDLRLVLHDEDGAHGAPGTG